MSFTGSASRGSVLRKLGLAFAVSACLAAATGVQGRTARDVEPGVEKTIVWTSLPAEARVTTRLIRAGGPFPYAKDGTVFGNRERLLPRKVRGHYREYTVKTPGARNRGARRIVCGGMQPTEPEACFYTADHYASFARIVQ